MEKLIHPRDHKSILETCKKIHNWMLKKDQGKICYLKVTGRVIEHNVDEPYRIEISIQLGSGWYYNETALRLLDIISKRVDEKWNNVKSHGCGYASLGDAPTYGKGAISEESLIKQMYNPQYIADKGIM